jgi:hypothetical protein
MDDKEYYSLMNRSSSWAVQQVIKRTRQKKDSMEDSKKTSLPQGVQTYTSLELRQGKADAEMLIEKQD